MPTMRPAICSVCGNEFSTTLKHYNESNKQKWNLYCSKECRRHKHSQKVYCANCGKAVWKTKSMMARSKTGNMYCSKSCAASMNNRLFKYGSNHPRYNGSQYRKYALDYYPNKCCVCGWKEDVRILEVHHKDEDRNNNSIENLIVLCPICHRKLTSHYYKLTQGDKPGIVSNT